MKKVSLQPLLVASTLIMVGAFSLSWPTTAFAAEAALTRSVAVTGVGEVAAEPDKASIYAGVTTMGDTAAEALAGNSKKMEAILEGMKSSGIDAKDIQTANFSVSPRYASADNRLTPAKIIGYQVSNTVSVTIRELSTLGEALDKFVSVGANSVNGIQFGFSEPKDLENQARVKAIEDAREKAELYAETAGVELGQVLTIQEMGANIPRPFMARAEAMSAVPIASGEETVSVQVNVTFGIQ